MFISLSLSLTSALIGVLTKQWLHQYLSIPSGTPRDRSQIRQYRYTGLEAWFVPWVVELLPVSVHAALAIFLGALVAYLYPLKREIAYVVAAVAAVSYGLYLASLILPLLYPQCPYKTPLSVYLFNGLHSLRHYGRLAFRCLARTCSQSFDFAVGNIRTFQQAEYEAVQSSSTEVSVDAIFALHTMSSNPTVRSIAIEAMSGLPVEAQRYLAGASKQLLDDFVNMMQEAQDATYIADGSNFSRFDRLIRAGLHFETDSDPEKPGHSLRDTFHTQEFLEGNMKKDVLASSHEQRDLLHLLPWVTARRRTVYIGQHAIKTRFVSLQTEDPKGYAAALKQYTVGPQRDTRQHPIVWMRFLESDQHGAILVDYADYSPDMVLSFFDALRDTGYFSGSDPQESQEVREVTLLDAVLKYPELRDGTYTLLMWIFEGGDAPSSTGSQMDSGRSPGRLLLYGLRWLLRRVNDQKGKYAARDYSDLVAKVLACIAESIRFTDARYNNDLLGALKFFICSDTFLNDAVTPWKARNYAVNGLRYSLEPELVRRSGGLFIRVRPLHPSAEGIERMWYDQALLSTILKVLERCHEVDTMDDDETLQVKVEFSEGTRELFVGAFLVAFPFASGIIERYNGLVALGWLPQMHSSPDARPSDSFYLEKLEKLTRIFIPTKDLDAYADDAARKEWITFLHLPDNLFILCRALVLFSETQLLFKLSKIRRTDQAWLTCFKQLLGLFDDEGFLALMGYHIEERVKRKKLSPDTDRDARVRLWEILDALKGQLRLTLPMMSNEYNLPPMRTMTDNER
jgi:hypothetical protein